MQFNLYGLSMSYIPPDLQYTLNHEWVRREENGSVTVGITQHAQYMLGNIIFIELPQEDDIEISRGEMCGVLESVEAVMEIFSPLTGVITDINLALVNNPDSLNQSPYDKGWLFRMTPSDESEFKDLLSAEAYALSVKSEAN